MPTLRALECFVAVVECGSVTAASLRLHLSQPALSHQLASLEKEIGTPLLERLPRGVRMTPAGRAVLDGARITLDAAGRMVTAGRAVASGHGGTLHVICAESMTVPILSATLRRWTRSRPEIRLLLTESTSADDMADAISAGTADVAICPASDRFTGVSHEVGDEEVVVVLPPHHRLAGASSVAWADLDGQHVIHYHSSNGFGSWIDSVAAQHNLTLNPVTRTRQAATAAQLAHAGLGIALVPTTALASSFSGIVKPLSPRLSRPVVAMIGSPSDVTASQFVADVCGRGIPVPAAIAAQLS